MKPGKLLRNFDYLLFISFILLTIVGIFFIYSANLNKQQMREEYIKQIIYAIFSLIIFFGLLFFSLKKIKGYSIWIYIFCLIGLGFTLLFGEVIMGQKRLVFFGLISLQFSEFTKIAVVLVLAGFYVANQNNIKSLKIYLFGCGIVFIPVAVILLLPDLGSALVYIPILLGVSYIAGINRKYLLYTVLLFFTIALIPILTTINSLFFQNENEVIYLLTNVKYVTIVFLYLFFSIIIALLGYIGIIKGLSDKIRIFFYWYLFFASIISIGLALSYPVDQYVLKQYQKDRLLIFFNPEIDPKGKGYNLIQSMNTVGNGGFLGKGWKKGEQIQNFFLPEQATDFIFPVIAEEKGFAGSLFILVFYAIIFYRCFLITLKAKDYWSAYIVIGLLSMLLFHILENIGMCVGIMPITGIPLPFLSYGGSFLITCYIAMALMMNIHINRFQY